MNSYIFYGLILGVFLGFPLAAWFFGEDKEKACNIFWIVLTSIALVCYFAFSKHVGAFIGGFLFSHGFALGCLCSAANE